MWTDDGKEILFFSPDRGVMRVRVGSRDPFAAEPPELLFEATAKQSEADTAVNRIAFLLLGLGVAAATVFVFDAVWKGRFHAVRRPLVDTALRQGTSR